MDKIFNSYPTDISVFEIYKELWFSPYFMYLICFLIFFVYLIILIFNLIKLKKELKIENLNIIKAGSDPENMIEFNKKHYLFNFIPILITISGSLLIVYFLYESLNNYGDKELDDLRISYYADWYKDNAKDIDKELTLKEYDYIDFSLISDSYHTKKSYIYFNGLGYSKNYAYNITLLDEDGNITLVVAYLDIKKDPNLSGEDKLELKYTSEFGENNDIGEGIYYGTLTIK